jgi:hypothetical protein
MKLPSTIFPRILLFIVRFTEQWGLDQSATQAKRRKWLLDIFTHCFLPV